MKVTSMIICIILVGITLISLGNSYTSYQSDLKSNDQKRGEYEKQESVKEKQAEESGKMYIQDYASITQNSDIENEKRDIEDKFHNVIIIHSIIVGFLILSEIGLLIVLPKK